VKAIRFNASIPRYALGLALRKLYPPLLWSGLSCTYSAQVPEPRLPGPDWVILRTRYGGICGSDLGHIHLHTSPYYSPFSSFPFTFGHENCATIAQVGEQAGEWVEGERVVVEPLLWCQPRGFTDLCRYCARGEINRCERHTDGRLAAGLMTGACRDTGGSWSEFFLAHRSQLYRVPDSISDENALMIEPFAVGLHAALQNYPEDEECVLLVGAGAIGLCTLAALRALGSKAEILTLARYPFQARAAERLGASKVIQAKGRLAYDAIAAHTGARLLQPIIGKIVVYGGVERTFECVGSDASLDDALRLTRGGGRVVLVGQPGIAKGVDWTAIMAKELDVRASFTYHHNERFQGEHTRTYDLAIRLIAEGKVDLGWMVTQRYPLDDYAQALKMLSNRANSGAIRAVFTFQE
jgi:L-iditol 2-dehydrogenase